MARALSYVGQLQSISPTTLPPLSGRAGTVFATRAFGRTSKSFGIVLFRAAAPSRPWPAQRAAAIQR